MLQILGPPKYPNEKAHIPLILQSSAIALGALAVLAPRASVPVHSRHKYMVGAYVLVSTSQVATSATARVMLFPTGSLV